MQLSFADLLRLIDERATAFRAAVAAAPDLSVQVPTCPEWTLRDLAHHLGTGRYVWAATVAAGPEASAKASPDVAPPAPDGREELLAWLEASARVLLDTLEQAGPDRACWSPWVNRQAPAVCGTAARRQLQEISVHTYDAEFTAAGTPVAIPEEVALTCVDGFLFFNVAEPSPWPYKPAVIDYHATEGRSWRVRLSDDGVWIEREPAPWVPEEGIAYVTARTTASDLILWHYGRVSPDDNWEIEGDKAVLDQIAEWDPSA